MTQLSGQPFQHMSDPRTADAEIAAESCSVLELARIEQRLVVASELERITGSLGVVETSGSGWLEPFQGITSTTAIRRNLLRRKFRVR
jgi:hypothetical protein